MNIRMAGFLFSALSIFSHTSNAALIGTTGKITRVQTGPNGEGVYVSIDQALTTSCSQKAYVFMATTAVQYKETYSTVLLAMTQGKPITLYYDNAAACGSASAAVLLAVAVSS